MPKGTFSSWGERTVRMPSVVTRRSSGRRRLAVIGAAEQESRSFRQGRVGMLGHDVERCGPALGAAALGERAGHGLRDAVLIDGAAAQVVGARREAGSLAAQWQTV